MQIQNTYNVDIFIDGLNIFEAAGTALLGARIFESILSPIPYCTLTLNVPVNWVNQRSFVDGTQIRFDIKSKEYEIAESLYFRLYDITEIAISQQFCKLELNGMLSFYPGYRYYSSFNMYGASSDVFKQVATDFKLDNDIDPTNDYQLWASGSNNLYKHLNTISRFGWINETSAMFWCFNRRKKLLYKNLTTLFRNKPQQNWTFLQLPRAYSAKEKVYGYSSARLTTTAGTENLLHEGYGGDDKYFDLLSYQWKYPAAKKVVAESNLINISKELSQGLSTNWYPLDTGNFHKNYWLARKQNARILSTYSTYIVLQCEYLMNYQIGQVVNFVLMDSQDETNVIKMATGNYIITDIDIHITTQAVTSTLKLAMQGLNGQATSRETY